MKNKAGKTIYIGKAKSLKKRLVSYFNKSNKDIKTSFMVKNVFDIEIIQTESEDEALILEAELIKKHKPKYNINLKDNKTYPFIKITNERFPRIIKTRSQTRDGEYFGPYVSVVKLRKILKLIEYLFPIRTCTKKLPTKRKATKCLNYHIGKCMAPCENIISEKEYLDYIEKIRLLLSGETEKLKETLHKKMNDYSKEEQFEKAMAIRDRLASLEEITAEQSVYEREGDNRDVIGIYGEGFEYNISVIMVRGGRLIDKKSFSVSSRQEKESVLSSFLTQYYHGREINIEKIVIPFNIEDRSLIERWLKKKKPLFVLEVVYPDEGLIKIASENARQAHKESSGISSNEGGKRLKEIFKLKKIPAIIEGFDIAHLLGKNTKAALVRFSNGKPDNSNYRIFNIKTEDINDPASIYEAVYRRYKRLSEEAITLPDLVLIDGGRAQLNAAVSALSELRLKINVLSLAKRLEDIYLPNLKEPVRLPKNDLGLRLLQRVRDEAHRFGNTAHSKNSRKSMLRSELENIKGIGPATRSRLIAHFGGIDAVKTASEESLSLVPGISKKVASLIYERFHKDS